MDVTVSACASLCELTRLYVYVSGRPACLVLSAQAAFEAERKDRLVREGRIASNLSAHEHETGVHFEEERVSV